MYIHASLKRENFPPSFTLCTTFRVDACTEYISGGIWPFYKEFEQFMEFYQSLCRFCSKSMLRKICAEKICVEKNDKYKVWVQTINAETQFTMTKIFVLGN